MACFFTISENQVNRIRKAFLKRVLSQDMNFFDKTEVGKLTQKMSSGIDRIRDGTADKLAFVLQAGVALGCGMVVALILRYSFELVYHRYAQIS
jgi:ATP-binding cassette subfamily B (MDR/TAP) protein 1